MDPKVGSVVQVRIKLNDAQTVQQGILRFCGETKFSTGKWAGIELPTPNGKNDGTVQGIRYFTCPQNHGIFVKLPQITVVSEPKGPERALEKPERGPSPSSRSRGSASLRSPASSSSPSRSASPAKPVITSPGLRSPLVSPNPKRLSSIVPSITTQPPKRAISRPSTTQDGPVRSSPSPAHLASPTQRDPTLPPSIRRLRSPSAAPQSTSTLPPPQQAQNLLRLAPTASPPSPNPPSPIVQKEPAQDDHQELQELRAKIRVLEAKRADDARHIRELETRIAEAESFVALRPKLQAKLNTQQTELIATRRELADSQQLHQLAESKLVEFQEQLEMSMLDKEVAEEKAELAESELEETKEKLAVLEVELGVLKEGAEVQNGEAPDTKSLNHIQIEKQNERLKEALIRLRDLSQETEHDHRRRIAEMEKEVTSLDELHAQYDQTLAKLSNAEVQIEDLKLQLDDALGAEEMLVQLTERNLMLSEKIEEMRITIEDLEALKELNDELEENHVETEKAMQEDLDAKDVQIRDHLRKVDSLEETCLDLEGTIGQFRDLVLQLQSEIDALRSQTQTAQHESATAASQTAAMVSLNLKLQSSASKNLARSIELELKKIEARETKELLSIVQPYLPQVYLESDSDATSAYLFFMRLAYKADLINTIVAQIHNLPESLNGPVPEVLVGVCEMRGRIASLSTLCKRFAAVLRRCDVASFLNVGRMYPEIAPLEKRIDMHIDLLRRDEFREMECVSDVLKMQAQFDHLAETYFTGYDHDLGERELGYALSLDHDLDVFGACIGLTRTAISATLEDEEAVINMGELDPDAELFGPLQQLLEQFKSAKALSRKLTRRLEDLVHDATAFKAHLLPQLKALSNVVPELVNFGISLAQQVMPYLSDVRGSKISFELPSVLGFVKQTVASTVAKDAEPDSNPWELVARSVAHLVQETAKIMPVALEPESVMKITGASPWVVRVAEIKLALAANVEAERKVAQLNDEMQALARNLKAKDQTIQESGVKIELMERRTEVMKKQADTITELENELTMARKQERAYEDAMEQLQTDLDTLEQDNAKLKVMVANPERQAIGPVQTEPEPIAIESNLETSHLLEQIEGLRGAVRFLRTENSYLKGHDLLREIEALPPLPAPVSRSPTPELEPSTLSDSEESSDDIEPPPTVRSLAAETKLLYRDLVDFSSSPRVVDLSALNAKRAGAKGGRIWTPQKRAPRHYVIERKMEAERLSRRVHGLMERASTLASAL